MSEMRFMVLAVAFLCFVFLTVMFLAQGMCYSKKDRDLVGRTNPLWCLER